MKKVGITGGIGSGKSLVSRIFHVLGVPVYDADSRARWLTNNSPAVVSAVKALLGEDAYVNGQLNRPKVASLVFPNPDLLTQLNHIVHPAVGADFTQWCIEQEYPYVLKEAALMFESGSHRSLDSVIHVTAPQELRIRRVLSRDPHRTEEEVRNIIARQMSPEDMAAKSDFQIVNDESTMLIPQVLDLHAAFTK